MIFLRNKIFIITLGAIAAATMFLSANFSNSSIVQAEELAKPETQTAKQEENTDIVDQGKCGDTAFWKFTKSGKLIIYGTGRIYEYEPNIDIDSTELKLPPWSRYLSEIKKLIIKDGIESIPGFAFSGLCNLKEAIIPKSVVYLGIYAFPEHCENLKLSIPKDMPHCTSWSNAVTILRESMKSKKECIMFTVDRELGSLDSIRYMFKEPSRFGCTMDLESNQNIFNEIFKECENPELGNYLRYSSDFSSPPGFEIFSTNNDKILIICNTGYETTLEQEEELNGMIKQLASDLGLYKSTLTDLEKLKIIYKYVTENIKYDYERLKKNMLVRVEGPYINGKLVEYDALIYTAYAALKRKACVCKGIAMLIYRLAKEANVKVLIVSGSLGLENHDWNIAKVGEFYYNLDATNDLGKPEKDWKYFLVSDQNHLSHGVRQKSWRFRNYASPEFHKAHPMSPTNYVLSSE